MQRCRLPMLQFDAVGLYSSITRCLFRFSSPASRRTPSSLRQPLSSRISSAKDLTGRTGSQPVTWSLFSKKNQSFMTSAFATQGEQVEVLHATNDDHGGVVVEVKDQMDSRTYVSLLRASLEIWRQQEKRGVWIKLPIELASLVQPTVEEGFRYHHAEPNYLMLVYWIPATQNTLPVNATHRVGVGAFVMNDKREVLAVQEKSGKFRGSGVWKFPTGVVDPGEDIFAGAVREVKEETGIDTEFIEVLAFRQCHKSFFDKSDLFFICMLHPISSDIKKQDSEVEAAEWIPIEQFAAQPFVEKHELLRHIIDLGLAKFQKGYAGFSPICIKSAFTSRQSSLYLNKRDLNQP
ncbi:nudix hydrolase 2-like [Zingiber officinale]|uniref:nudix hydrolase 2-like n=1 Tax=Zingiber officinale TaxID=94328 RepID=UPI001C4AD676|nr:nudix hydrolase 2-like [Zingiber officinale]